MYNALHNTLDYQIAVGYEINVAFPEINKRSLFNNRSG